MKNFVVLAALLAALSGCTVGPDYVEASKAVKLPDTLTHEHFARDKGLWKEAVPSDSLPKGDWWKIFGDKTLDALLERCCKNNPDLAAAFYRVEQARESALMDKADLYPQIDGHASYSRTGTSKNARMSMGTYNNWLAGFGLTWDLDLFGRIRSLLEADIADAQAMLCAYKSLMLDLEANVARTYFSVRALKSEVAILERTLDVRREDTKLVRARVAMDYSTNIDLQRAIQQEHDAAAQLASCKRSLLLGENTLALLIGSTPTEIGVKIEPLSDGFPKMPQCVPSQLLERRPDIAEAERGVYAANARIGAAQAAFFPTVSLTANTDLNTAKFDKILQAHSFAWGVSPQIYLPIFEAGRNIAQKRVALAAHKESLEQYRSVVLTAIKEVEDALASIRLLADEFKERVQVVAASYDVQRMTRIQYDEGYTDYFSVSEAQRQHLTNERALIVLRGDRYKACVDLIQSIGGGWDMKDVSQTEPLVDKSGRQIDPDYGQNDILPTL